MLARKHIRKKKVFFEKYWQEKRRKENLFHAMLQHYYLSQGIRLFSFPRKFAVCLLVFEMLAIEHNTIEKMAFF